MKTIFSIILLVFLGNCHSDTNKIQKGVENNKIVFVNKSISKSDTINKYLSAQDYRKKNIEKYKRNILSKGDKASFALYNITLDNEKNYTTILPYALLMAEKYKNKDAYETFYTKFIKILNNGEYQDEFYFDLEIETHKFLKNYLIKGANLGQTRCKEIISNLEEIAKIRQQKF